VRSANKQQSYWNQLSSIEQEQHSIGDYPDNSRSYAQKDKMYEDLYHKVMKTKEPQARGLARLDQSGSVNTY